jgi:hypothetical protein
MSTENAIWAGPLSLDIVEHQVKAILFGAARSRASAEAFQAEAIRLAVWSQTAIQQEAALAQNVVSTRRVLKAARMYLIRSNQDEQESVLERNMLDSLADQGDLYSFPGGNWLPAPLRLVPITASNVLLVGGVPTYLLSPTILEILEFHGSFRRFQRSLVPHTLPTPNALLKWQYQSLSNWLGPSPPALRDLIQLFHSTELLPVEHRHQTLEAYVASLQKWQELRWQMLDHVRGGRYLLRTSPQFGSREYTIGIVQNHQIVRQSLPLRSIEIRRLCYALDEEAHVPTSVEWGREKGSLVLRSELPTRERKFLATVGQLQVSADKYYPRSWVNISPQFHDEVENMLSLLAVRFVPTKDR